MEPHCPNPGLGSLSNELLLHILKQQGLGGQALAAVEAVSRTFARRHAAPVGGAQAQAEPTANSATEPLATLPEMAAKLQLTAMHPDVSFEPGLGENWKQLLAKVDVFGADYSPNRERPSAGPTLLSKTFRGFFGGEFYHNLKESSDGMVPLPTTCLAWLEETAANGCAAAQYCLGTHCEMAKILEMFAELYRKNEQLEQLLEQLEQLEQRAGRAQHVSRPIDIQTFSRPIDIQASSARARALYTSAARQHCEPAAKALARMEHSSYDMDDPYGEDRSVGTFTHDNPYWHEYDPLRHRLMRSPEPDMAETEVQQLSPAFRDAIAASTELTADDMGYGSGGIDHTLPDAVESLRADDNEMDQLFLYAYWAFDGKELPAMVRRLSEKEYAEVKKRQFCAAIYIQNASFYQDRLGTNILGNSKKSGVSVSRWHLSATASPSTLVRTFDTKLKNTKQPI